MISDTPVDVFRRQAALLRDAGPLRRASLAGRMTQQAIARAKSAIRRAHPTLSERDRAILFVRVHYGRELADAVRARLERQP